MQMHLGILAFAIGIMFFTAFASSILYETDSKLDELVVGGFVPSTSLGGNGTTAYLSFNDWCDSMGMYFLSNAIDPDNWYKNVFGEPISLNYDEWAGKLDIWFYRCMKHFGHHYYWLDYHDGVVMNGGYYLIVEDQSTGKKGSQIYEEMNEQSQYSLRWEYNCYLSAYGLQLSGSSTTVFEPFQKHWILQINDFFGKIFSGFLSIFQIAGFTPSTSAMPTPVQTILALFFIPLMLIIVISILPILIAILHALGSVLNAVLPF